MAPPRPRWTGRKTNKAPAPSKANQGKALAQEPATSTLPLDLQQQLLNIFKNAFAERFEGDVKPLLQEVKGHLYNRDFATAFGKEEYLEAYALRWSPSRALGYLQILYDLREDLHLVSGERSETGDGKWNLACLGGGAGAEIIAVAGLMTLLEPTDQERPAQFEVTAIDIASWEDVVSKLWETTVNKPPLSKYASAAVQAANKPLVDKACFSVNFNQKDILNVDTEKLSAIMKNTDLVTLLFTLNELYTTSLALTQKFLLNLTTCAGHGTCLLVVDSPGSYSSVTLNGAEKKYPMQWLLDHTLLSTGTKGPAEEPKWEKIKEEESKWSRLDERLKYPIELEDMRYQLHLYRRLG